MRIALTNQHQRLVNFLPAFKAQPLSYTDYSQFPERYTARLIPTLQPISDLSACNLDFLFAYAIFPAFIMQSVTEWQLAKRGMQLGDVIVQQAYLPPLPLSLKCIFAVRILAITQSARHVGFQYGTITGHAETGMSEFAFVVRGDELYALIHTCSQPGHILSRMVAPFFTVPYQQYCTNKALAAMKAALWRVTRIVVLADGGPTSACSRPPLAREIIAILARSLGQHLISTYRCGG